MVLRLAALRAGALVSCAFLSPLQDHDIYTKRLTVEGHPIDVGTKADVGKQVGEL